MQDWTKPVGYHVTVPCSKDQAGLRTFDAAFAVERSQKIVKKKDQGPSEESELLTVIKMKYMHTTLRYPEAYHSRLLPSILYV